MMSAENIKEMLNEIGLPYEYDHFSTHNWIEASLLLYGGFQEVIIFTRTGSPMQKSTF